MPSTILLNSSGLTGLTASRPLLVSNLSRTTRGCYRNPKYENRPLGEKKRIVGESVPYGRMGLPADHAGEAVFLASSDSDYVVAQTLNVDGGNWMS
jgi:NAD(P)-dependent dehydrogenase (short-subunit alcohol dehydrogenase family)